MLRCPSRVFFSDEPRGIAMKPVFGFPGSVVLLALPVTGSWAGQGTAASSVAAPETSAVSCSKLNVNGRKPGESLPVRVTGQTAGTLYGDAGVYPALQQRLGPG